MKEATQPASSGSLRLLQPAHEDNRDVSARCNDSGKPDPPFKVTVMLPAYNEAQALPVVLTSVLRVLGPDVEILVVDDGSTDGTASVARQFPCRVIQHGTNLGKGAAMRTGFRAASGDIVVVVDADNTYPAEAIPELIAQAVVHDLVRGVRIAGLAHMPSINRLGNRIFVRTLELLHGLKGGDYLTGLYAIRRESLDALDLTSDGFDIEVEICIKAQALKLRTATIPIHYHERIGKKKLSVWKDGLRILRRAVGLAFLYRPKRVLVFPGFMFFALTWALALTLGPQVAPSASSPENVAQVSTIAMGSLAFVQTVVYGVSAALHDSVRRSRPRRWIAVLTSSRLWSLVGVLSTVALTSGAVLGAISGGALLAGAHTRLASGDLVGLALIMLTLGVQGVWTSMYARIVSEKSVQEQLASFTGFSGSVSEVQAGIDVRNIPLQRRI